MTDEECIIKIYCLGDELEEIYKIIQESSTRTEIVSKLKEAEKMDTKAYDVEKLKECITKELFDKIDKLNEQIDELQTKLAEIYEIIWTSETSEEIVSKLKEAADNGKIPNPNGARATD